MAIALAIAPSAADAACTFGANQFTPVFDTASGLIRYCDGTTTTTATLASSSISAGGSNTQVQFNNSGALGGAANLTWNNGTSTLTVTGTISVSTLSGSFTLATANIAASAVTNAKLANMAANTIKGNNTGGATAPLDLTVAQATAMLNAVVGDSGSGGTKGLVPAPAAGDAAASKFLKADGTWATAGAAPSGTAGYVQFSGGSALSSSSTGAGNQFFWDTTNHRLGIGTVTPSQKLDVAGTINAQSITSTTATSLSISPASGQNLVLSPTGGGQVQVQGSLFLQDSTQGLTRPSVNQLGINAGGSERVRIDASGNVGIGTPLPTNQKLWVVGGDGDQAALDNSGQNYTALRFKNSGNTKAEIQWYNPSNDLGIVNSQAGGVRLYTSNTERLSINSTGNVGIGDTTPDHKLDVAGNIGLDASGYINFGDTDGSTGYGIRDSSGTIQYKNSAGSWTSLGTGNAISQLDSSVTVTDSGTNGTITLAADGTTMMTVVNGTSTFNNGLVYFPSATGGTGTGSSSAPGGSAGQVQFNSGTALAGDNALFWDNSTKLLGVGTDTPTTKLTTKGGYIEAQNTGGTVRAAFNPSSGDFLSIEAFNSGNTAKLPIALAAYGGNVTIGTTTPSSKLTVITADGAGNVDFTIGNDTTSKFGRVGYNDTADILAIQGGVWGGTTRPVVLQGGGGNVGIGTTTPTSYKLEVSGTVSFSDYLYANGKRVFDTADGWLRLNQAGNFSSGVYTPGIMRADASLRSPIFYDQDNTGYYVDPAGTSYMVGLQLAGGLVSHAGYGGSFGGNNFNFYWTGGCAQLWVDTTMQGCIAYSSDRRLKADISTLGGENGLAAIEKLNPVSFNWRNPETSNQLQFGFIAQEVEKVLPNLVRNTGLKTPEAPDGIMKVEYNGLFAPLVKAVQELNANDNDLKAKNAALKTANDNLQTRIEKLEAAVAKLSANGGAQ